MINYNVFTLSNGMRVVHHFSDTSPMAGVALLCDVGSADEDEDRTGLAHLIEHMMFGGSANVPDYDQALERAGAVNNAWTSTDETCYHEYLPVVNIETALWAESDRILSPSFTETTFETQRKVVIEEFKQQRLNRPYGDSDHLLRSLMFRVHPYRYPTIGKEIAHLEAMTLDDVKAFFCRRYVPENIVLSMVGDLTLDRARELAEKWFGNIPATPSPQRALPEEPAVADGPRRLTVTRQVPQARIMIAYQMGGRKSRDYIPADLITDVLAGGLSSRFETRLMAEHGNIFTNADAYIYGSRDKGLLVLIADLADDDDQTIALAEQKLREQVRDLAENGVERRELTREQNKRASTNALEALENQSLAAALAKSVLCGEDYNEFLESYNAATPDDILQAARRIFRPENSGVLVIKPEPSKNTQL